MKRGSSRFQDESTHFLDVMSFAKPHRVDPPNAAVPHPRVGPHLAESERRQGTVNRQSDGSDRVPAASGANHRVDSPHVADSSTDEPIDVTSRDVASKEDWLRLHGTDLVDRLQTWASDLDAREAQLNARSSLQDHRERRFRLHQQDLATELAEQQRSSERLRLELEAQARRLAFSSDSPTRSS